MAGDAFTLSLTDIANGGQAVGHWREKTIFVPYAIPGEEVRARIVEDKGRYAFAEGVAVLDPSADRVLPACPHFTHCGGCHWQHMDYHAQLALKTDIVADQLERVGGFAAVQVAPTLPAPQQWGYRHEALLLPLGGGNLGYRGAKGGVLPIEDCPILTPALLELWAGLDLDLPTLTRVVLRDNGAGEMMLTLGTTDDEAPALELDLGVSVNFLLSDNEPANLIGATHLHYPILGRVYRVTAGAFWRSNPPQIATLAALVQDWLNLGGDESILDLYAGVGLFSGVLAGAANLVTCVDSYPPAMHDAEENLGEFDNVTVIEGGVGDVLLAEDEAYDIALLDPPPSGLGVEVIDALGAVLPPRLVYIADDPATLARDAKRLHERYHYTLEGVQPIDFEPQTFRTVSAAYLYRG